MTTPETALPMTGIEAAQNTKSSLIPVIDAFRFLAAFWVVISHASIPALPLVSGGTGQGGLVSKLAAMPFCGIAAVMIFFVISGFCIHYPAARGRPLQVKRFYMARLTRIGLPLVAAVLIFMPTGFLDELHLILWSVYCEIVYYLAYPLLFAAVRRWGMLNIFSISCIVFSGLIAWALVFGSGIRGNFASWGIAGTTLLGLPVWLGGCFLSESLVQKKGGSLMQRLPAMPLWIWRGLMLVLISVFNVAHFHSPLTYKLTMPLIGILSAAWLYQEIRCAHPPAWLADAGMACYSIYLMHQLGIKWAENLTWELLPVVRWSLGLLAAAVASYLFYLAVERPSHWLARRLGRMVN